MPDDSQNPLGGAQALETKFESLWQAGAFDSQNPKEAAQLQAQRDADKAPVLSPAPAPAAAPQLTAEPSKEDSGAATAAPESTEEPEYVNLDDYLQKAGVERDSFLSLPVRLGETDVPLAEVLKRAQAGHEVESQTTALAARQQAFEAEQAKQSHALQERLTAAEQLGNLAYQQLLHEYQQIDWNALSQTDPGRWAVLNTQFQQRVQSIQGQLQQIQVQRQQEGQQAQAKQLETLKVEQQKLLAAIPEWRDAGKFKAARESMTTYGKKLGFNDDELNTIFDHRYMRVLHDAAQWNQQEAGKALALKKVRAAPQISTPGARIARDPKVAQLADAKARFAKNPKNLDAQIAWAEQIANNLS